jgi:hypothetical protein
MQHNQKTGQYLMNILNVITVDSIATEVGTLTGHDFKVAKSAVSNIRKLLSKQESKDSIIDEFDNVLNNPIIQAALVRTAKQDDGFFRRLQKNCNKWTFTKSVTDGEPAVTRTIDLMGSEVLSITTVKTDNVIKYVIATLKETKKTAKSPQKLKVEKIERQNQETAKQVEIDTLRKELSDQINDSRQDALATLPEIIRAIKHMSEFDCGLVAGAIKNREVVIASIQTKNEISAIKKDVDSKLKTGTK